MPLLIRPLGLRHVTCQASVATVWQHAIHFYSHLRTAPRGCILIIMMRQVVRLVGLLQALVLLTDLAKIAGKVSQPLSLVCRSQARRS